MTLLDGGATLPVTHVTALDWRRLSRWSLPASDLFLSGLLGAVVLVDVSLVRAWRPRP